MKKLPSSAEKVDRKNQCVSSLASVAQNVVFCDNDVDAADLHLIFHPEIKETHRFSSGSRRLFILNYVVTVVCAKNTAVLMPSIREQMEQGQSTLFNAKGAGFANAFALKMPFR
jgi:hypothetical protein